MKPSIKWKLLKTSILRLSGASALGGLMKGKKHEIPYSVCLVQTALFLKKSAPKQRTAWPCLKMEVMISHGLCDRCRKNLETIYGLKKRRR